MNDKELMQQALDALNHVNVQDRVQVITALRERLAQPEPVAWHTPECEGECIACLIERTVEKALGESGRDYLLRHVTTPQPEQEPVAWMRDGEDCTDCITWFRTEDNTIPLYTAPQPRQWQGLTDEELNEAMEYWSSPERSAHGGADTADGEYVDMKDTWRYIEEKLKEKNT